MGVPGWVGQMVVVVVLGLGLGLGLGGWFQRRSAPRRKQAPVGDPATMVGSPASAASRVADGPAANEPLPPRVDTPQQRLLERLRENNLALSSQLRASAGQHARLLTEKDREVAALKADYDLRVEELRQAHCAELKDLMTLLVEQVDGIHEAHANQVKALQAQVDGVQRELRRRQAAAPDPVPRADDADTTMFARTEVMGASGPPH